MKRIEVVIASRYRFYFILAANVADQSDNASHISYTYSMKVSYVIVSSREVYFWVATSQSKADETTKRFIEQCRATMSV